MKKTKPVTIISVSILISLALVSGCSKPIVSDEESKFNIRIATWNIRGYPEKQQEYRDWFHQQLEKMSPDILCIQEIANQDKVNQFLASENRFREAAFTDSSDSQDNAIFCTGSIEMEDIPDPFGFQHPAQTAYVSCGGFDAIIVTVHLSWTDITKREQEKMLLKNVVLEALKKDPDVIIAGDFNTEEEGIIQLAESIGMVVMVPAGQDGAGTTHAGNRYDHFLISPDLANEEALSCWIVTFAGADLETAKEVSDHLPVLTLFRTNLRYKDRQ